MFIALVGWVFLAETVRYLCVERSFCNLLSFAYGALVIKTIKITLSEYQTSLTATLFHVLSSINDVEGIGVCDQKLF